MNAKSELSSNLEIRLKEAVHLHHIGYLDEAEDLYRSIMVEFPNNPNIYYNLGMLTLENNRFDEGLSFLRTALEIAPQKEIFWTSYISSLIKAQQYAEAELALSIGAKAGLSQCEIASLKPFKVLPIKCHSDHRTTKVTGRSYSCRNGLSILGKSRLIFDLSNYIAYVNNNETNEFYKLLNDYFLHEELVGALTYDSNTQNIFSKRTYTGSYLQVNHSIHLKGRWLSLADHASENWMHWLSEVLPRFFFTGSLLDKNIGLIIDENLPHSILQTLHLISAERPLFKIKKHTFVQVEELVVPIPDVYSFFWNRKEQNMPTVWSFNHAALNRMSEYLKTATCCKNNSNNFLIYNQRKAAFRHIKNELDLKFMLENFGFLTINSAEMTAHEQIDAHASCRLLVCQAGAALANIAFMPTGSLVLVLILESIYIDYKYFFDYAAIFGVSVIYAKCDGIKNDRCDAQATFTVDHPTNQDMICNLDQIRAQLIDCLF